MKISDIYEKLENNQSLLFLDENLNPIAVNKIQKTPYNGNIYDVTVPNHIILIKRHNLTTWSGNSLYHNFTNLEEGTYTYTAYAQDLAGNTNSTETRTITIDQTPPTVTLDAPGNNAFVSTSQVTFQYTPYDNTALANCSIWLNSTGAWAINATDPTPVNNTQNTTTITLADGTYIWNIHCYDNASNSAFNTINHTLTVDTTPPTINITYPLNTTHNTKSLYLNFASTEYPLHTCWFQLNSNGTNITIENCQNGTEFEANEGQNNITLWANDTTGNLAIDTEWFTVSTIDLKITKYFQPDTIMAGENETINVTTTVQVNKTSNNVTAINITDEIPYDFTYPETTEVTVWFIDASAGNQKTNITNGATISTDDRLGQNNTWLNITIYNLTAAGAPTYLHENDSIQLNYEMTSSKLNIDEYRTMHTNATAQDINLNKKSSSLTKNITVAENLLRAYKEIWHPDLSEPNNISVRIRILSIGDPLTEILLADYLPQGANIISTNITYYNKTSDTTTELHNHSDYNLGPPAQDTLPDGTPADIYHYNLSYNYTNWDSWLYNNDTITIEYNVTVLGGGEWVLPAILGGFDPSYQKHIKTEMYGTLNVPQFDIILQMLTKKISPGETVDALLKIYNVGGPKAKVDVVISYSAKDMQGNLITESTDTVAVVETREDTLSLDIPDSTAPGQYNFEAFVTYTGKEAISTRPFEIKGEKQKDSIETYFGKYGLYGILLLIILLLLLFRRTR